jgi:hypothetical protein
MAQSTKVCKLVPSFCSICCLLTFLVRVCCSVQSSEVVPYLFNMRTPFLLSKYFMGPHVIVALLLVFSDYENTYYNDKKLP